jgi:hypothetical protein
MSRVHNIFPVILIATVLSCDKGTNPPIPIPDPDDTSVPNDIVAFVASQLLPKAQKPVIFVQVPEHSIVGFTVDYGDPIDCPAGCFYSRAYGLRRADKIGWVCSNDCDGVFSFTPYRIDSTDWYFYTQEFWDRLDVANSWFYHYALLHLFARDPDTPIDVLKRLAESLHSYIHDYLGWLLLDHPKVASNREILTIIANLPHYNNEGYDRLRAKAQEMLALLGG